MLYYPCRIAGSYRIRRYILCNDAVACDYRAFADGDALEDGGILPYPDIIPDDYRCVLGILPTPRRGMKALNSHFFACLGVGGMVIIIVDMDMIGDDGIAPDAYAFDAADDGIAVYAGISAYLYPAVSHGDELAVYLAVIAYRDKTGPVRQTIGGLRAYEILAGIGILLKMTGGAHFLHHQARSVNFCPYFAVKSFHHVLSSVEYSE